MYTAIHTGPDTHLDHLAVICEVMQMPLIVTEESHAILCHTFYPHVKVIERHLSELTFDYIAHNYAAIFECGKFWAMELQPVVKMLYNKTLRLIHCPHGNSDKESFLKDHVAQDLALIYGPQMRELYSNRTGQFIEMGNLRAHYYEKHKSHLDQLAATKVFNQLDRKKKTILYAPTWVSNATPSSFFSSAETIIQMLSKDFNLLIKLHPLLEENHPGHFWHFLGKFESAPGVKIIQEFPAIYPLLAKTDIYLGDYSSIGYDFLYFDRPLFFLCEEKQGPLQKCGKNILLKELPNAINDRQKHVSYARKATYAQAFGSPKDPIHVHADIKKALFIPE